MTTTQRSFLWTLLLALLLGFSFQGARGIWDADEGRYVNVALQMLDSGDWSLPRRHPDTLHLTKPPLTYWAIAASASVFGNSEQALRLPNTLAYVLTVLLCFGIGRRLMTRTGHADFYCGATGRTSTGAPSVAVLTGPSSPTARGSVAITGADTPCDVSRRIPHDLSGFARPWLPALVYATLPMPFLASSWITTDTLLTAFEALALYCCVEACFGGHRRAVSQRWVLAMWAAFGLAFLTKGPPSLLPLLGLMLWRFGGREDIRAPRLFPVSGVLLFLLVGGSWYVWAMLKVPGLFDYYVGREVADRVLSEDFERFPQWWGAFYVYGLAFLLGAIPWLYASGLRRDGWLRRRPRLAGFRDRWRALPASQRLLWLWLLLPLAVFFLARSRLPLYVLPLFVPMAVLIAQAIGQRSPGRIAWIGVGVWCALLLALKFATGFYEHRKDGRQLAAEILPLIGEWPAELVFIDDYPRYSLAPYCGCRIEMVSLDDLPRPRPLAGSRFDDDFASEMAQPEGPRAFIMDASRAAYFEKVAAAHGHRVRQLGGYRQRVIYRLDSDPPR